MKRRLPLILFLLALGLRIAGNTIAPPSPYWEETALGYDAYSILQTARDHHGNLLPLVAFPSFGDYKPSLYFYTLVPSIAVFGLNAFAVRLPAAIFSAATTWLIFKLLRRWSSEKVAFWSAVVLAFQPWSWQVGRVGFETNLAAFLLVLGVFLLDRAFDYLRPNSRRIFLLSSLGAAATFALSMYAYHGARLIAPLFAALVWLINTPWPKRSTEIVHIIRSWLPSIVTAAILILPILLVLRTPIVQQRITETSVFTIGRPVEQANLYRETSDNLLTRVLFHRNWFWLQEISGRYLSHLSPQFLFGRGDVNPRHTSQLFGALYPWEFFTILIGLAYGAKHFRQRRHWLSLLGLILLSPAAAALTVATPHALRALPLSPWIAVLSGLGLAQLSTIFEERYRLLKRIAPLALFGLVAGSFAVLAFYFFSQYRPQFANEWQYGYQELFAKLWQYQNSNESIYVSREYGRPAMFLWFYEKTDPRAVQSEEESAGKDQLERLTFQEWKFVDGSGEEPGLHAVKPDSRPENAAIIDTVTGLDGITVWVIYRK